MCFEIYILTQFFSYTTTRTPTAAAVKFENQKSDEEIKQRKEDE
jgi:hypothetical protein